MDNKLKYLLDDINIDDTFKSFLFNCYPKSQLLQFINLYQDKNIKFICCLQQLILNIQYTQFFEDSDSLIFSYNNINVIYFYDEIVNELKVMFDNKIVGSYRTSYSINEFPEYTVLLHYCMRQKNLKYLIKNFI